MNSIINNSKAIFSTLTCMVKAGIALVLALFALANPAQANETYYDVLGIQQAAPWSEVLLAYDLYVKSNDPSTGGDTYEYLARRAAFEYLKVKEQKQNYDNWLNQRSPIDPTSDAYSAVFNNTEISTQELALALEQIFEPNNFYQPPKPLLGRQQIQLNEMLEASQNIGKKSILNPAETSLIVKIISKGSLSQVRKVAYVLAQQPGLTEPIWHSLFEHFHGLTPGNRLAPLTDLVIQSSNWPTQFENFVDRAFNGNSLTSDHLPPRSRNLNYLMFSLGMSRGKKLNSAATSWYLSYFDSDLYSPLNQLALSYVGQFSGWPSGLEEKMIKQVSLIIDNNYNRFTEFPRHFIDVIQHFIARGQTPSPHLWELLNSSLNRVTARDQFEQRFLETIARAVVKLGTRYPLPSYLVKRLFRTIYDLPISFNKTYTESSILNHIEYYPIGTHATYSALDSLIFLHDRERSEIDLTPVAVHILSSQSRPKNETSRTAYVKLLFRLLLDAERLNELIGKPQAPAEKYRAVLLVELRAQVDWDDQMADDFVKLYDRMGRYGLSLTEVLSVILAPKSKASRIILAKSFFKNNPYVFVKIKNSQIHLATQLQRSKLRFLLNSLLPYVGNLCSSILKTP